MVVAEQLGHADSKTMGTEQDCTLPARPPLPSRARRAGLRVRQGQCSAPHTPGTRGRAYVGSAVMSFTAPPQPH